MSLAFNAELNAEDCELLNKFNLQRLEAAFPVLRSCKVQRSSLNNDLLVICDRPTWDDLQPALVDIRMASWTIAAVNVLSIFADGYLVYCASTQLLETLATIEPTLESIAQEIDSSMVATKTRPTPTQTAPTEPAVSTVATQDLPKFIDLNYLAQKAGIPVDRIAAEINQLGGVAGILPDGAYMTTDKDQRLWVSNYLKRLEADFLMAPSTVQIAPQALSPQPSKRSRDASLKNGKAPTTAVKTIKEPRLRDFFKAQSYAVTIGRFLDAQGWEEDSPLRAEVFEGIAAFPEDRMPTSKGSLAERSFHKILSKYPASSRGAVAKGMIKIAKETIGGTATNAELAPAEPTEVV
jgi:hypothetical protein